VRREVVHGAAEDARLDVVGARGAVHQMEVADDDEHG